MRLLGIDPGLHITGYGLVSVGSPSATGSRLKLIEAGIIRTAPKDLLGGKLRTIFRQMTSIIEEFDPGVVVIEKLYSHYANPLTAIGMGHARGVICLAAALKDIPMVDIASTHAKKAVMGQGHGSKAQMQRMVQQQLSLKSLPEPADVADALGLTIAYAAMMKTQRAGKGVRRP